MGHTQEEYDARLLAVLERIQTAGITLNTDKCDFSKSEMRFLGHVVSVSVISPDSCKTEAVKRMPMTVNILRSLLGMVNQLGRFIP